MLQAWQFAAAPIGSLTDICRMLGPANMAGILDLLKRVAGELAVAEAELGERIASEVTPAA